MPAGQVLEFNRVTKRFGAVTAVTDLTVRVEPGVVTGFLGPNGAGKTTSLRMLLGQIRPTSGTVTIGGASYAELRHPLRTVGAVLEESAYRPRRTAARQLLIAAKANSIPASRVDEVLRLVGLQEDADTRLGSYSLGMRQRLTVASALLGDPGVLVLDEPANGLDPEGIRWMRLLMRRLADEGRTVLVSSHVLSEIEQVADNVVVLSKGRAVYSGPMEKLADPSGGAVVVDAENRARLITVLSAAKVSFDVLRSGVTVRDSDAATVGAIAAEAGVALTLLQQRGPSLEDVFLDLVYGRRTDSPRLDEVANPVAHAPQHTDTAAVDAVPAGATPVAAAPVAAGVATAGAAAVVADTATADAAAPEPNSTDTLDAAEDDRTDAEDAEEPQSIEADASSEDAAAQGTPSDAGDTDEISTGVADEETDAAETDDAETDDANDGGAGPAEDTAEDADAGSDAGSDDLLAAIGTVRLDRPADPVTDGGWISRRARHRDEVRASSDADADEDDAADDEVSALWAPRPSAATDGDADETASDAETPGVLPLATQAVSLPTSPAPASFTELITGIPASAAPDQADTGPLTEAIPVFTAPLSGDADDDAGVDDDEDDPRLAAMRTSLSTAASRFFQGPAPDYPYASAPATTSDSDAPSEPADADGSPKDDEDDTTSQNAEAIEPAGADVSDDEEQTVEERTGGTSEGEQSDEEASGEHSDEGSDDESSDDDAAANESSDVANSGDQPR